MYEIFHMYPSTVLFAGSIPKDEVKGISRSRRLSRRVSHEYLKTQPIPEGYWKSVYTMQVNKDEVELEIVYF